MKRDNKLFISLRQRGKEVSRKILGFSLALCLIFIEFIFAQIEEKPVLAVLTLEAKNISKDDALIITNFLQQEFFYIDRYKLVERTQVDKVLKEYQSQHSGVCDFDCAVHIGKLLSVNRVILGSVGKLGNFYTIQIKMLDIKTKEVESMSSIRARGGLGDLPNSIGNLVNRLIIPAIKIEPKVEKLLKDVVKKSVKKEEKKIEKIPIDLTKLEGGKIRVKVHPYADVLIDGKLIGEVPPIRIQEIEAGKHTIEFVSSRLNKNFTIEVEIKAGESKEIRMNMETGECKIVKLSLTQ